MSPRVPARSYELTRSLADWLSGSVDLACNLDGLIHEAMGLDPIDIAIGAGKLGMRAIVLQAHDYCTAPIAAYLAEADLREYPISLLGSVALNRAVGGLNVYAVEHSLMLAGKVVHMPTVSAENYLRRQRWPSRVSPGVDLAGSALSVVDGRGGVGAETPELLEVIAARAGVLGAGFLHASEVLALFEAARAQGVRRLLAVNPMNNNGARPADVDAMLRQGAYIMISAESHERDRKLVLIIAAAHPDRLILGLHAAVRAGSLKDHYSAALSGWWELGLGDAEIRRAIRDNPRRLLGLSEHAAQGVHPHG